MFDVLTVAVSALIGAGAAAVAVRGLISPMWDRPRKNLAQRLAWRWGRKRY